MKTIAAAALICLIIALVLPLSLAPGAGDGAEPEEGAPAAGADADTEFTVLSGWEAERVNMADYLPGVVAAEMPALFEPDALKAQAVAARSFILSRTLTVNANHPEADVCDDPDCCKAHNTEEELREKWGGDYDEYWQKMLSAVRETDGQYLEYGGEPIFAAFHSSSAGMTEGSGEVWNALPYLVSVPSPEDEEDVPDYVTTVTYTEGEFASRLREGYPYLSLGQDPAGLVEEVTMDESGRVSSVTIAGQEVPGTEMRALFELRSTAFELEYASGSFTFTVTGYGHGVGMSQYGANVLAGLGTPYTDILAHYYPGTELVEG